MEKVKSYIDKTMFKKTLPNQISHSNISASKERSFDLDLVFDDEAKDIIRTLYQKDFEKFHYDID